MAAVEVRHCAWAVPMARAKRETRMMIAALIVPVFEVVPARSVAIRLASSCRGHSGGGSAVARRRRRGGGGDGGGGRRAVTTYQTSQLRHSCTTAHPRRREMRRFHVAGRRSAATVLTTVSSATATGFNATKVRSRTKRRCGHVQPARRVATPSVAASRFAPASAPGAAPVQVAVASSSPRAARPDRGLQRPCVRHGRGGALLLATLVNAAGASAACRRTCRSLWPQLAAAAAAARSSPRHTLRRPKRRLQGVAPRSRSPASVLLATAVTVGVESAPTRNAQGHSKDSSTVARTESRLGVAARAGAE